MRIVLERFCKSFGQTRVIENMDLEVRDGELMALLGPSGCGKTTTLFAVSGIHRVTSGRILFGDRDVHDLPPQERNVGIVFQSYALYPHLDVYENIAFPLRIRRERKDDIDGKVRAIVRVMRIEELLARRPSELSGGQQQRVALARALVREPDVLLLDEPLANLDAALRLEMRGEVRRIQQESGTTAILVTHDQAEAMSMCDRIALMNNGRILQVGAANELYDRPIDRFVAGFLGSPPISFYPGVVKDNRFEGAALGFDLPEALRDVHIGADHEVTIGVRPEFFQPKRAVAVDGSISMIEPLGRETLYDVALADGRTLRSVQAGRPCHKPGDMVRWGIDPKDVLFFDAQDRRL